MNKIPKYCYINGCSWTYGDSLKDPVNENFSVQFSKNLQFEQCINDSQCGGSNHRIVRTTLNFLLANKDHWDDLLVIIGWSCPHRIETWSDYSKEWLWINQYRQSEHSEKGHKARLHYQNFWNEINAYTDYFRDVITLQSFLKQNNIKYYMFRSFAFQNPLTNKFFGLDSDHEQFYQYVQSKSIPEEYVTAIDSVLFPSFINFTDTFHDVIKNHVRSDNRTFMQHYPVHPNKEEHALFAEYLTKKIKELI